MGAEMRALPLLALALVVAVVLGLSGSARAVERTVAGSAQIDYLFVPTAKSADANTGTGNSWDGFTLEATLKLAVDITDHVSANVKFCYGCHGFEADMVYFDLRAFDELNFRVGRFSPGFGAFNLRHDVANQKLSDKPLPYDMGRMLRNSSWNAGVLPAPFPDNGAEIDGTHFIGDAGQLDYAVYGVAGFRTSGTQVTDIEFNESHLPYYVDNNARPTGGARLALTLKPSASSDITIGASGMAGTYDDLNQLWYEILGGDFSLRVKRTTFRMEYLVRKTDFYTTVDGHSNQDLFKYGFGPNPSQNNFFIKQGAYAEIEQPLVRDLDLILRVDGLKRDGNVPLTDPDTFSPVAAGLPLLTNHSHVLRETLGLAYAVERNIRLKLSGELYQWSDPDALGHTLSLAIHAGVVGSF
jgi:hypothetical protein